MHKKIFAYSALIVSTFIYSAQAKAVDLSLGGGYPFLVVPTISLTNSDIRYYANYKAGLDDGFSLGAEILNGKHKYGAFIGAVGARKTDARCSDSTLLCTSLFDHQTTQGIGLSYEYHLSSNLNSGWAVRLEAGYGEESYDYEKRTDGNIQFIYHF
ncbi:hypothetical protein J8L98_23850 [Pseudoalteromonas sp. MMG013]|uniref:hypothetical protein n=1 Tax=Pseudoalteromonas sp. MMG013 TaxID=2822687 RepID=UPI001B35FAFD|nr:hypothetical protein [Pseudoalteromonas sp. MMG013]MBQ4864722.1 hypothetical protein [Pseudoalteromonas sp. MMG013]